MPVADKLRQALYELTIEHHVELRNAEYKYLVSNTNLQLYDYNTSTNEEYKKRTLRQCKFNLEQWIARSEYSHASYRSVIFQLLVLVIEQLEYLGQDISLYSTTHLEFWRNFRI